MDAGLGAAGEHRVGVAALDQLRGLADRVRAGRARRDDGVVRAADAERDRELAARRVDEDVREEVRRDPVGAALAQNLLCSRIPMTPPIAVPKTMPTRGGSKPFSPASPIASRPAPSASRTLRSSLRTSFGEATAVASKSLTSAAIRTGKSLASKEPDPVDAALARDRRPPRRRRVVSERRDRAEPCDRDPPHPGSLDGRPREVTPKACGSFSESGRNAVTPTGLGARNASPSPAKITRRRC